MPPYFGTKIRFVSPETFKKYKPNDQSLISDSPFEIKDRVSLKKKAYTEEAFNCNVIVIHNTKKVSLAHLWPERTLNKTVMVKELSKDIKKLKSRLLFLNTFSFKKKPVHTLITGGRSYAHYEALVRKNSKKLFHLLIKTLRQADISHLSIIWGVTSQDINNGGTSVFCDAAKDEILISNPEIALNIDAFRKAFRFIHIAEGDSFEIEGDSFKIEGDKS